MRVAEEVHVGLERPDALAERHAGGDGPAERAWVERFDRRPIEPFEL